MAVIALQALKVTTVIGEVTAMKMVSALGMQIGKYALQPR